MARVGGLATDSGGGSLRRATLVLFAVCTVLVSFAWVATYTALGLYPAAASSRA